MEESAHRRRRKSCFAIDVNRRRQRLIKLVESHYLAPLKTPSSRKSRVDFYGSFCGGTNKRTNPERSNGIEEAEKDERAGFNNLILL